MIKKLQIKKIKFIITCKHFLDENTKTEKLEFQVQTFKAHNRKYLPYPKLVRDATLYFRTAKRAKRHVENFNAGK